MLVYARQKSSPGRHRRTAELRTVHGDASDRAIRSVRAVRRSTLRRRRPRGNRLGWLKGLLFVAVAGVLLIWQRTQVVRVGQEVHRLHLQRRQLVDEVRDLRTQFERATSYDRIRRSAERELGFVAPPVRVLELP